LLSLKCAKPVRGRAETSRRPVRRARPAAGRRRLDVQAPPVRVPEVARAFPRSRLASRCLEHRERPENRAAVRARHGPAVLALSSGVRAPQGTLVHPPVARRLARRYLGVVALPSTHKPSPPLLHAAAGRHGGCSMHVAFPSIPSLFQLANARLEPIEASPSLGCAAGLAASPEPIPPWPPLPGRRRAARQSHLRPVQHPKSSP
jgi:hypothetical protein